jgi:hypothetical protein
MERSRLNLVSREPRVSLKGAREGQLSESPADVDERMQTSGA